MGGWVGVANFGVGHWHLRVSVGGIGRVSYGLAVGGPQGVAAAVGCVDGDVVGERARRVEGSERDVSGIAGETRAAMETRRADRSGGWVGEWMGAAHRRVEHRHLELDVVLRGAGDVDEHLEVVVVVRRHLAAAGTWQDPKRQRYTDDVTDDVLISADATTHREVNCNWAGSETEPETGRLRNPQWW